MLITQMAVNPYGQSASVLVAEPFSDRGYVDAALDTTRGKQVAEIVMGKASAPDFTACSVEGLLTLPDPKHV